MTCGAPPSPPPYKSHRLRTVRPARGESRSNTDITSVAPILLSRNGDDDTAHPDTLTLRPPDRGRTAALTSSLSPSSPPEGCPHDARSASFRLLHVSFFPPRMQVRPGLGGPWCSCSWRRRPSSRRSARPSPPPPAPAGSLREKYTDAEDIRCLPGGSNVEQTRIFQR